MALDRTITKAFHNIMSFNPETQPRKVEVWANVMFKAIKLKNELKKVARPNIEEMLIELFGGDENLNS